MVSFLSRAKARLLVCGTGVTLGVMLLAPGSGQADTYCDVFPSDALCPIFGTLPQDLQTTLQGAADEMSSVPVDNQPDSIPDLAPADAIVTGIFNGEDAQSPPVPVGLFSVTNASTSVNAVDGTVTGIWAGASYNAPALGMVVTATYTAGMTQLLSVRAITSTTAAGALTIENVVGSTVQLQSTDGSLWVFGPALGKIVPA